jgi:NAD kinase
MVFSADSELEIETSPDNRVGVHLRCDGFDGIDVSANDRIIISRAREKAKLISMDNVEFFNVLHNKIMSAI